MTKQEWLSHFKKQEELGISGYRYCRDNSISQSMFAYWKNKLIKSATPVIVDRKFVQVLPKKEEQKNIEVSISKVGEKITISFPHKNAKQLATLMRELL
jgi:hypothetical protein